MRIHRKSTAASQSVVAVATILFMWPALAGAEVASPPPDVASEEAPVANSQPAEDAAVEGAEVAAPAAEASKGPAPAYNLKLRAIEERVNQLKEKIFKSKARLIQLQEVVLHGTITGAKAVLMHRNQMGSSFKLFRVQYSLDGAPIFSRVDSGNGELSSQEEIEIFNGSIAPGNHQISTYLEYFGHGYGVFSYLKGYKFKIKSSYTFSAEEGKLTTIQITGLEKGGITTQLEDRPSVEYKQEVTRELRRDDIEEQDGEGESSPSAAEQQ